MKFTTGLNRFAAVACFGLGLTVPALAGEPTVADPATGPLTSVAPDAASGSSRAVIVDRSPLVFTEQLLPRDAEGKLPSGADAQIRALVDRLDRTLAAAGSSLDRVAKLNFYVVRAELADSLRGELAKRRRDAKTLPAVSFVQTRLSDPQALVAVDAVACTDDAAVRRYSEDWLSKYLAAKQRGSTTTGSQEPTSSESAYSILPHWPIVYISGDAKPGDLPEATTATLESLETTWRSLSTVPPNRKDKVVQLKCFLQPMSRAAEVRKSIDAFFSPVPTPPVVMVEWTMPGPIEIEWIVDGFQPIQRGNPAWDIRFYTPPGVKASPVFSRVAMINAPKLIYFSGLYSASNGDGATEVTSIFEQLDKLLPETGSDFRHLAKATYYVSAEGASSQLNVLRPKYYDPARPPAASKAPVAGVARPGRTITLDMIAVPPINK